MKQYIMSTRLLSTDAPARLPRLVNTLFVIALGFSLSLLSLKFLPQSQATSLASQEPLSAQASRHSAPSPTDLARVIASVHLFGDASKKPIAKPVERPKEPIRDTRLNLQLAGVFAFQPAEKAIAIISAGAAEQNAYGIGDKINADTTLEAVYADHVILRNRGKLEKLALPENVQPISVAPVRSSPAQTTARNAGANTAAASTPINLPSNPRELRDTLARNPSMLGRVVSAEPYQENGKLVGYRISPKQNPEILEAQGIMAGDVITRVNNIQLNSQKQGIRALRNAVKAENLEVVVLRGGVEVPVSISLAQ